MADRAEDFDAFYLRCRDILVMQVMAVCGDPTEAMDFVQEAFLRAWVRWARVGDYDDPEGWVRRVAVNLGISRWRRARRLVVWDGLPAHQVALLPGQQSVISALGMLPTNQRHALVLHHLVGLSVEETATEMKAPTGTVKSWLSRGRTRLASVLAEEASFSDD